MSAAAAMEKKVTKKKRVIVRFAQAWTNYSPGDEAAFTETEAAWMISKGLAREHAIIEEDDSRDPMLEVATRMVDGPQRPGQGAVSPVPRK